MGHLDEGLIQAFLDGETTGPEAEDVRGHLDACTACRNQVRAHRHRLERAEQALGLLDSTPEMEGARTRVQALAAGQAPRVETTVPALDRAVPLRQSGSPKWARGEPGRRFVSLPRAASIALLVTGAAVTALPGSPVRQWILDGWRSISGPIDTEQALADDPNAEFEAGAEQPTAPVEETAASILPEGGGVEIWIQGAAPESELAVFWTDDEQVRVVSGVGTRYRTAAGRLEAFSPNGPVRIEIPRAVGELTVGANGRTLLRKVDGSLDVLAPTLSRGPDEIRFAPLTGGRDGGF